MEISSNMGRGDKLDDVTFISNNQSVIAEIIPKEAINLIGTLEYNGLLNAKSFIYSEEELTEGLTQENYLIDRLYAVQSFLSAAWLIVDNSINFELGFVFLKYHRGISVSSNHLAVAHSSCRGEKETIRLNRDEL